MPRRVTLDVKGRFRTAILGDLKLIYTPGADAPWELYKITQDPHETHDLWESEGDSAYSRSLMEALKGWMAGDAMTEPLTLPGPDDLEALRALGYIED